MSYAMDQPNNSLIDEIDSFVADAGMSPITFGRKALGDPHFVSQLRNGRRLWPETEAKVRRFIAEYQSSTNDSPKAAA